MAFHKKCSPPLPLEGTEGRAWKRAAVRTFCRWRQQTHPFSIINVDATYRIRLFTQVASPLPTPAKACLTSYWRLKLSPARCYPCPRTPVTYVSGTYTQWERERPWILDLTQDSLCKAGSGCQRSLTFARQSIRWFSPVQILLTFATPSTINSLAFEPLLRRSQARWFEQQYVQGLSYVLL
jgi:hypothetical protein